MAFTDELRAWTDRQLKDYLLIHWRDYDDVNLDVCLRYRYVRAEIRRRCDHTAYPRGYWQQDGF